MKRANNKFGIAVVFFLAGMFLLCGNTPVKASAKARPASAKVWVKSHKTASGILVPGHYLD